MSFFGNSKMVTLITVAVLLSAVFMCLFSVNYMWEKLSLLEQKSSYFVTETAMRSFVANAAASSKLGSAAGGGGGGNGANFVFSSI
jgi:hypothetical protein